MPSNPQPRVLCVDDDEDSREMLSALLRLSSIDAVAVGTAFEALSSIQSERFNLYLLDTQLPDLDGFELCRQMRDLDSDTPILFFSGAAYATDIRKGLDAGANAYVSKPDIEGLIGSITQFCFPKHGAATAVAA
ncbi:MAG TPA: response regulator [Pyrinomonadaceae bacterium]|nr:response regulator [Pyrinomonadaceae bacterium]